MCRVEDVLKEMADAVAALISRTHQRRITLRESTAVYALLLLEKLVCLHENARREHENAQLTPLAWRPPPEPRVSPSPKRPGRPGRPTSSKPSKPSKPSTPPVPPLLRHGLGCVRPHARRCGKCNGCLRARCGECRECRDSPAFGGCGIRKRSCVHRKCLDWMPLAM
jgi:hypothetical protein